MNNKPVAWMLNGILHELDPSDWAKEQYPDQDVIPLYTHPVKELTDEEIYEIADKFIQRFEYEPSEIDEIGFARAILRKAKEK